MIKKMKISQMKIIDLTNLTQEDLVEREMIVQDLSREEAEKYWKEMYEASAENDRQHEEFMKSIKNDDLLTDDLLTK